MDPPPPLKTSVKKMAFTLGDEETISDSEYESAQSRPHTPDRLPASSGERVNKKRLRRGTGLPAFRFPRDRVDEDVEKIEEDVNRLLNLGEAIRHEVEDLRKETHTQKSLTPPDSTPTSSTNLPFTSHKRSSSLPDLAITFSNPHGTSGPQEIPPLNGQPIQDVQHSEDAHLQSLQESLTTIRTHLAALETAISANISSQLLALTGRSEPPPVLDYFSLPSFRVEKRNRETVHAVLDTVKVTCAVERGLEALVMALEVGKKEQGGSQNNGKKIELMDACRKKPYEVGIEMQKAVSGMRKVLKATSEKS